MLEGYAGYAPASSGAPAYAGTRQKRYDTTASIYNRKQSNLRRTQAGIAKAVAGTASTQHIIVGASITNGTSAGGRQKAWPRKLCTMLNASGVPANGGAIAIPAALAEADPRISVAGGTSNGGGYISLGAAGSFTYNSGLGSPTDAGQNIEIAVGQTSTGPATITVDGATVPDGQVAVVGGSYTGGTVTMSAASAWGRVTITGLTNATHTVVVTRVSGTVYLGSIECYANNAFRFHNLGIGTTSASSWAGGLAFPNYSIWPTAFFTRPDAIWFELGGNDEHNGRTPAQFAADMETLRANYVAAWGAPQPDIILVVEPSAFGDAESLSTQSQFYTKLYDMADAFDYPLVDFSDGQGLVSGLVTNGLNSGDVTHPNEPGQYALARQAYNLLNV